MSGTGPYSLGYNGHAKKCDCVRCANVRKREFSKRIDAVSRLSGSLARQPTSIDQTVFVRAHFKRAPNHLRQFPRTRMAVTGLLRRVERERAA